MTDRGYAVVSLDELAAGETRTSLTGRLGCTDTRVDACRPAAGESVELPAADEFVCVALDSDGKLTPAGGHGVVVPRHGVARLPAGVAGTLESATGTRWLAASASADPSPGAPPAVVTPEGVDFEHPSTSGIPTARLTARLGCAGMKVNFRRLAPGAAVPYHTEGTQEELFVPLDAAGTVRVDGESHRMSAGDIARVAPPVPRSAVNEGTEACVWLMIGAPPTGDADGWDPGAEVLDPSESA